MSQLALELSEDCPTLVPMGKLFAAHSSIFLDVAEELAKIKARPEGAAWLEEELENRFNEVSLMMEIAQKMREEPETSRVRHMKLSLVE